MAQPGETRSVCLAHLRLEARTTEHEAAAWFVTKHREHAVDPPRTLTLEGVLLELKGARVRVHTEGGMRGRQGNGRGLSPAAKTDEQARCIPDRSTMHHPLDMVQLHGPGLIGRQEVHAARPLVGAVVMPAAVGPCVCTVVEALLFLGPGRGAARSSQRLAADGPLVSLSRVHVRRERVCAEVGPSRPRCTEVGPSRPRCTEVGPSRTAAPHARAGAATWTGACVPARSVAWAWAWFPTEAVAWAWAWPTTRAGGRAGSCAMRACVAGRRITRWPCRSLLHLLPLHRQRQHRDVPVAC